MISISRCARVVVAILALACSLLLSGCLSLSSGGDIALLSTTGIEEESVVEGVVAEGKDKLGAALGPARKISEFDLVKAVSAADLRFQTGDTVKVLVWGYPELDHTATVQANGKITLPLAGEIDAAGATVGILRQRIADGLQPFTRGGGRELRTGDSLTLDVWQQTELRHTAMIEPDGMATFPLVGRVAAAGREVEAIRKEVEVRMLRYLREARVSILPAFAKRQKLEDFHVSVVAARLEPRRVALIGEVNSQGLTEIKGSLRIVEALAQAQLRQATAAINSIVVIRNPDTGSPQYRMIRLRDYFEGRAPDQNIYLQHDDIVIVPKTTIAKVGDFVEQFFTRTVPVFNWWSAAWQASVAQQSSETTELINEALRKSIIDTTVSP